MSTEARRVCPSCGYEYEDWVEVCPDCNAPIQVELPKLEVLRGKLGVDEDPRWTVVTNVPNIIIGSLIKDQLQDAGIPVYMLRSSSADIGQFSHYDYAPHDIRVPLNRVHEARRLIDSPPGGNLVEQDWEDFNSQSDEAVMLDDDAVQGGLPEGWSVLPTETDIRARQMLRRSMGNAPDGWYWSDRKREEGVEERGSYWQDLYDRSAGPGFQRKGSGNYDDEYEDYTPYRSSDPYRPNKWVRWFYAILMLAMSLPFIFQLITTLFSFGQPLP